MKQPALFKQRRGRVNADQPSSLAAPPFEGQARHFNSRSQTPQLGDEKALASAFALLDKQVTNSKSEFGWRKWVLPDGRVARMVIDKSGTDTVRRIEIPAPLLPKEPEKEAPQEEEEFKPLTQTAVHRFGFPDYACGLVISPTIKTITVPAPTEEDPEAVKDIDIINGVRLSEEGHYRVFYEDSQEKLAVDLPHDFATLADYDSERRYSIHHRVKSGLYTGYMRVLVQLMLGLGNIQTKTYEKRRIKLGDFKVIAPDGYAPIKEIAKKWGLYSSFYKLYSARKDGVAPKVEVKFDYQFGKTHGLTKADDGQCYIIEIGMDGAYAWPLEIDPLSKTPAGRRRCELLYPEFFEIDSTGQMLFDYFGGFPSGKQFPKDREERQHLINAGEILELCDDLSDFYSKSFFSSSQGWAFAQTAREAVNTVWYTNAQGYKVTSAYAFHWSIAGSKNELFEEETSRVVAIRNAMKQLGILKEPWYERKLLRIESEWGVAEYEPTRNLYMNLMSALYDDQFGDVTDEEREDLLEEFHAIKVTPKFAYSGSLTEQQTGVVYSPARYNPPPPYCMSYYHHNHPQIKFPEPLLGIFLITFNFQCTEDAKDPKPTLCDAPVWVGFFGDQKIQINYWWEDQTALREDYNKTTREECQFTGEWVETRYSGFPGNIQGNFYATDIDLRKQVEGGTKATIKYSGQDAGTTDFMRFIDIFARCCSIRRQVFFDYLREEDGVASERFRSAIAIPFNDRSVYYSVKLTEQQGVRHNISCSGIYQGGTSGYVRYGKVYHFICHWAGCPVPPRVNRLMESDEDCVMGELLEMQYAPSCFESYGPPGFPYYKPCLEGDKWGHDGGICLFSMPFNINVQGRRAFSETTKEVNVFDWEVRLHGDTHIGGKKIAYERIEEEGAVIFDTTMSLWWFMTSLNSCNIGTRVEVGVNRWGTPLINYDEQIDPMRADHSGEPESLYSSPKSTFVGYVSNKTPGDE
jgi:hypothetical protein